MKTRKKIPSSLPDAACHQLKAIAPFITEKSRRIASERLRMTDEKVALLIVKAINPYEVLTQEEEAILRGVSRDKLRTHKTRKELPFLA